EMQQLHRHHTLAALPADPDEPSRTSPGFDRVRGYGLGLVVEHFPDLGDVISHSGGYPGYGSFMVLYRGTGVGVVALAHSKDAPVTPLSMKTLRLLQRERPDLIARRPLQAAARTLEAADAALSWLREGDDAVAVAWLADNMDPDISRQERRRRLTAALTAAGLDHAALAGLRAEGAEVLSRARLRWTVPGRGAGAPSLRIEMLMDPRREALLQSLDRSEE